MICELTSNEVNHVSGAGILGDIVGGAEIVAGVVGLGVVGWAAVDTVGAILTVSSGAAAASIGLIKAGAAHF